MRFLFLSVALSSCVAEVSAEIPPEPASSMLLVIIDGERAYAFGYALEGAEIDEALSVKQSSRVLAYLYSRPLLELGLQEGPIEAAMTRCTACASMPQTPRAFEFEEGGWHLVEGTGPEVFLKKKDLCEPEVEPPIVDHFFVEGNCGTAVRFAIPLRDGSTVAGTNEPQCWFRINDAPTQMMRSSFNAIGAFGDADDDLWLVDSTGALVELSLESGIETPMAGAISTELIGRAWLAGDPENPAADLIMYALEADDMEATTPVVPSIFRLENNRWVRLMSAWDCPPGTGPFEPRGYVLDTDRLARLDDGSVFAMRLCRSRLAQVAGSIVSITALPNDSSRELSVLTHVEGFGVLASNVEGDVFQHLDGQWTRLPPPRDGALKNQIFAFGNFRGRLLSVTDHGAIALYDRRAGTCGPYAELVAPGTRMTGSLRDGRLALVGRVDGTPGAFAASICR